MAWVGPSALLQGSSESLRSTAQRRWPLSASATAPSSGACCTLLPYPLLQAVAASLEGLPPASIPPLHLAKGNYFSLAAGALSRLQAATTHATSGGGGAGVGAYAFHHLVYPLPEPSTAGLGTHLTLDLAGDVRFGPDVEWCACCCQRGSCGSAVGKAVCHAGRAGQLAAVPRPNTTLPGA